MLSKQDEINLVLQKELISPLEHIVLNSQYFVLQFNGLSDGSDMNPLFPLNVVQGKRMLLKSIRLLPYSNGESDILWNKTSGDHFTIPDNFRLHQVEDIYPTQTRITFEINGTALNMFPVDVQPIPASPMYNLDLFVDNVYYNYKSKITSLNFKVDGSYCNDFEATTTVEANMKVLIECYLY